MAASVPQAVQSCHELLLWLIPQPDKFPRARRFTLGERIEAGVLVVLELLVEAAYTRGKDAPLQRANLRLEVVRHLWRLAYELKVVAIRQYEHGARLLDDLELQDGTYQPGDYRLFTIYERKPRIIAAAPFRDRVVHHAIMNCIEPPLDRTFISDSYACRRGKGVHAAVDRYQAWAQTYRYVLKMDVRQYFPSIDHALLKEKLRRRMKDWRVLDLLDHIIDGSPRGDSEPCYFPGDDLFTPFERRVGIPIGNLTSQFFANLYLDELDHSIKQELRVRPYLRYVDDMVILDNAKARLGEIRAAVRERLAADRLRLHPNKAHLTRVVDGLNLLGYVLFPDRRRLRNDNGHRFARKLHAMARAYRAGRLDWAKVVASSQSWIGHAKHAETEGLRRVIFSQAVFIRGAGQETAGA